MLPSRLLACLLVPQKLRPAAKLQTFVSESEDETGGYSPSPAAASPAVQVQQHAAPAQSHAAVNLLDWDDSPAPAPALAASAAPPRGLVLQSRAAELSPQTFQSLWMSLPDALNVKLCSLAAPPAATAEVEACVKDFGVRRQ